MSIFGYIIVSVVGGATMLVIVVTLVRIFLKMWAHRINSQPPPMQSIDDWDEFEDNGMTRSEIVNRLRDGPGSYCSD